MPQLQTEFPFSSLDFPGRTTLYPHELAERLGCSIDQVHDLADEGAISAIDIASPGARRRELRVPIEAWRNFIIARMTGPMRRHFLASLPAPVFSQLCSELDALRKAQA